MFLLRFIAKAVGWLIYDVIGTIVIVAIAAANIIGIVGMIIMIPVGIVILFWRHPEAIPIVSGGTLFAFAVYDYGKKAGRREVEAAESNAKAVQAFVGERETK